MQHLELARQQQRIDHIFELMGNSLQGAEIQAHGARYLCVLVSGYLEITIRTIYRTYGEACANPNVARYVARQLNGFQNPRMEPIVQLAGSFNAEWGEQLKAATDGEIKDAVDSLIDLRNSIAHGRDVDVTYARVRDYYERARRLVNLIQQQCQGSGT